MKNNLITEYTASMEKEVIDIEIGPPATPVVDHSFSVWTLIRAYATYFLTQLYFKPVLKPLRENRWRVSPSLNKIFALPMGEKDNEHSALWNSLLSTYKHCKPHSRKKLAQLIGLYLEGRVLCNDILAREKWIMPGIISLNISSACNLRCNGCHVPKKKTIKFNREFYQELLTEFRSLGGRIVLLLGGEPMLNKKDIFAFSKNFPDLIFFLFSNGTLFTESDAEAIANTNNIIPILSIEGDEVLTDDRRGSGVFAKVSKAQAALEQRGVLHGVSVMVHSGNSDYLCQNNFLADVFDKPHHFTLFMAYSEREPCPDFTQLNPTQLKTFTDDLNAARRTGLAAIFLPYDEMTFLKGCGGSRMLIHVNSDHTLAHCPYTHDHVVANLDDHSLRDALKHIQASSPVSNECLAQRQTHVLHYRKIKQP